MANKAAVLIKSPLDQVTKADAVGSSHGRAAGVDMRSFGQVYKHTDAASWKGWEQRKKRAEGWGDLLSKASFLIGIQWASAASQTAYGRTA